MCSQAAFKCHCESEVIIDLGIVNTIHFAEKMCIRDRDIPLYGLVKDDKHRTRGLTDESIEFDIERDGILFKFLTRMQDEVHRFAIEGFRRKHENSAVHSVLEDIPGIGPAKRKKLLNSFGSIAKISRTSKADLQAVIGDAAAAAVIEFFNRGASNDKSRSVSYTHLDVYKRQVYRFLK